MRIQPEYDTFKKSGYKVYQTTKAPENTSVKIEVQSPVENNDALLDQLSRLAELKERACSPKKSFIGKEKLTRN